MCTSFACVPGERYRKGPDEKYSESTLQTGCPLNHSAPDFNRQFVTIKRLCIVTWRWKLGLWKSGNPTLTPWMMTIVDLTFGLARSPRSAICVSNSVPIILGSFWQRRPASGQHNIPARLCYISRMYLCAQFCVFFHSFRSLNISSILSVLTSCAKKYKIKFVAVEAWHGWRSRGTTSEASHDFEL